jgi:hypothetical protein
MRLKLTSQVVGLVRQEFGLVGMLVQGQLWSVVGFVGGLPVGRMGEMQGGMKIGRTEGGAFRLQGE